MLFTRRRIETSDSPTSEEIDLAYERGREDERRRRRRHPILGALMFVAAVLGVGMIYLAAREGSFTRGGEVVDRRLASAADTAHVASQDAPSAAVNAGQTLRQNSARR
jgi:hypothetical protein